MVGPQPVEPERVEPAPPAWVRPLGFAAALVATAAALVLSLRHLGAAELPGCGLASACERALGGPFGTLPVLHWPLAFLGAAFFLGQLAAWTRAAGGWPAALRWSARAGALASLALLALALQQGTPCPYCLVAQGANLAFVVAAERAPRVARARGAELAFLLAFALATGALALAHARGAAQRAAADERALAESADAAQAGTGARAFTGRYVRGPVPAPLRLVMFTDYQCPDCARIEGEAWQLVEERGDLSLSVKHFPLNGDCNRRARDLGHSPHKNACWAARAAEAAGLAGGNDGFWRMHRWLFERKGSFTDPDLRAALPGLGFEVGAFLGLLHASEPRLRVEADVEEALALGIQSTPLLYLNGVELRGWRAPQALRRAVEALAARAPAASGPEADRPPGALEKGLADWRAEPLLALGHRHGEGLAVPGQLEIVVWSDYLEPGTRELDRRLRAFQAAHPEVRYSFRHYPLDAECVPGVPRSNPGACLAARAAEAARHLGGEAAFEALHARLMETSGPLGRAEVLQAAGAAGLDVPVLEATLEDPRWRARVEEDVAAAKRLGIHSIPLLVVGNRKVPRWRLDGVELLEPLLLEALGKRGE
ncbi:MAG TPA: DsbA family protein [Planctomycetota bacterium]